MAELQIIRIPPAYVKKKKKPSPKSRKANTKE